MNLDLALRLDVGELYAAYAACLDDGRLQAWPDFFTEDCRYRLIPRENHERGLPLATMAMDGIDMLRDRVFSCLETLFHQPYYQRHLIGPARITGRDGNQILAEANYLVIRTRRDEPAEVFNAGRYLDRIATTPDGLRFAEKLCVFDTELIPNAIIYPI